MQSATQHTKRPNIVIFNPDQWRADVMGHLGNPAAVTPFLDRLATTEAVSFRNAFCQNPVCTPSRCSFMTGLYPHVRGHRTMYHMLHEEQGETNLLAVLKRNGYRIFWGGKNDLVPGDADMSPFCDVRFRPDAAFCERHGIVPERGTHATANAWRGPADGDEYYSFYCGRLTGAPASSVYGDGDWCTLLGATEYVREYDDDAPFCLFLALEHPHPPYAVEEPFFSLVDRAKLPPRISDFKQSGPMLLDGIRAGQRLGDRSEARWTELRATYYGMCARVDKQLEMLADALKTRGFYDDTALFMFSDHGDFTGDYGLVEKTQNTFEDCLVNVPLVFKPPRDCAINPGVRDALAELVDVSETIYELAGIDPGYDRFGKSLVPLLAHDMPHRDAVFCEGGRLKGEVAAMEADSPSATDPEGLYYPRCSLQTDDSRPWHGKAVMCRTAHYKYVFRLYEDDEFYDLADDPHELRNRIADPAAAPVIAELRERTLRHMVETADIVPRQTDPR